MSTIRAVSIIALAGLLGACASVPLGTMWKLRHFGPEELARVDPAQVRIATRIEPGNLQLDPAQVALRITLQGHDGGSEVHAFGVEEVHGFSSALTGGDLLGWQAFRLDDEGRALFERFQPVLRTAKDTYASMNVTIEVGLIDPAAIVDLDAITLTSRLQLAADEDAFTLVDRARVRIEQPPVDATAD